MTVTISAADAQGNRNEETVYQRVSTDAMRALLKVLAANAETGEGTFYLADDDDTYAFYGELGCDVAPAALKRILGTPENISAETRKAVEDFGPELIQKLINLGQLVRFNVGNSVEKHQATVSTDGTYADEPVMDVCYSNARYAFRMFGRDLPTVTEVFTHKAQDILAGEADIEDHYVTRLLGVAQYAVKRFGPDATLLVG